MHVARRGRLRGTLWRARRGSTHNRSAKFCSGLMYREKSQ
jgi:hypothetical protein